MVGFLLSKTLHLTPLKVGHTKLHSCENSYISMNGNECNESQ